MEQPPPLTPQEVAAMQNAEYATIGQPQTVKVFGILHIVFASFGILASGWAVFVAIVGNPFLMMSGSKSPAVQAQMDLQKEMMPVTLGSTALTLTVATLMMTAGILMLKRRRNGLKWSNRYAYASLFAKAVGLALVFTYTLPMMKELTAGYSPGMGSVGMAEQIMITTVVASTLLPAIYPILSLILLNRPKTKEWFAAQPE